MKVKTYIEKDRTIKIILNDSNNVIVEVYDYAQGVERLSVDLMHYYHDFNVVLLLYKTSELFVY